MFWPDRGIPHFLVIPLLDETIEVTMHLYLRYAKPMSAWKAVHHENLDPRDIQWCKRMVKITQVTTMAFPGSLVFVFVAPIHP